MVKNFPFIVTHQWAWLTRFYYENPSKVRLNIWFHVTRQVAYSGRWPKSCTLLIWLMMKSVLFCLTDAFRSVLPWRSCQSPQRKHFVLQLITCSVVSKFFMRFIKLLTCADIFHTVGLFRLPMLWAYYWLVNLFSFLWPYMSFLLFIPKGFHFLPGCAQGFISWVWAKVM